MYQLLVVLLSFSLIPILIKRNLKLSYTLLLTAGLLGVLSNIGLTNLLHASLGVFTNPASRTTVLTVAMVSILGGLMGHYKILDRIVGTLEKIIRNKKNILIIIPAFMGLLIIPGGALLSAPFINNLGKDLRLSPARRSVINLVFRHIAMFIMPYSTGLLIIGSSFPELNIMKIILLNLVFVSLTVGVGYFLYIRDIEVDILIKRDKLARRILKLLLLSSPIYIPVLINLATGLPFYITLLFSVAIVYILSDKKEFIRSLINSIGWHTVLTVIAILIIKEIILSMDSLLIIFNNMFDYSHNSFYILAIFFLTSLFFGFITGNINAALAIVLPMVSQLDVGGNLLYLYIYFAYGSSFMGYYFSPVHLCQVFTLQVMEADIKDLYREYSKYGGGYLYNFNINFFPI